MNKSIILMCVIALVCVLSSLSVIGLVVDDVTNAYTLDRNAEDDYSTSDGTVTGAVYSSSGALGGSYVFDGNNDYITLDGLSNFDLTKNWTFSTLYNTTNELATWHILYKSSSLAIELNGDTLGSIRLIDRTTFQNKYTAADVITAGIWQHLIVMYNGTYHIWVDGDKKTLLGTLSLPLTVNANDFLLGRNTADSSMNGSLDEVYFLQKAVTQSEVDILYNSGNFGRPWDSYFINQTGGVDSNNGLTTDTAFKTIDRTNNVTPIPSDSFLYSRNEEWRESTDAYMSFSGGDSSGNITYGAYGIGNKPIILGSYNCSGWVNGGAGNIWNCSDTFTVEVGNIIFNNTNYTTVNKTVSYAGLVSEARQGVFYYDSSADVVSLYSTVDPDDLYSNVELARTTNIFTGIEDLSNLYINNFELKYGARVGIELNTISNVYVHNITMSFVGGGVIAGSRLGNGIQIWKEGHNVSILYNNISEIFDAGITPQYTLAGGNFSNILIAYNILEKMRYCFEVFNLDTDSSTDVLIHHNTCVGVGKGWSTNQLSSSSSRQHSVFLGAILGSGTDKVNVTDNIFDGTIDSFIYENNGCDETELFFNYNLYNNDSGITEFAFWELGSNPNLADFQSDEGQELNGQQTDPLFVDAPNGDFRLKETSPARNAGSDGTTIGALGVVMINPSFANNQDNASATTFNGWVVQINITIKDNSNISAYTLTTNNTGTFTNETPLNLAGDGNVTMVWNFTISDTFASTTDTFGWMVWANDTLGNVNVSNTFTFLVTNSSVATTQVKRTMDDIIQQLLKIVPWLGIIIIVAFASIIILMVKGEVDPEAGMVTLTALLLAVIAIGIILTVSILMLTELGAV